MTSSIAMTPLIARIQKTVLTPVLTAEIKKRKRVGGDKLPTYRVLVDCSETDVISRNYYITVSIKWEIEEELEREVAYHVER
jgi:hypothetical protein